jgi:hypothetical protein
LLDKLEVVRIDFGKGSDSVDAGIVHQHIGLRLPHEFGTASNLPDIREIGQHPFVTGIHARGTRRGAGSRHHRPLGPEHRGDCVSYPPRGPGDENLLAGKTHGQRFPPAFT